MPTNQPGTQVPAELHVSGFDPWFQERKARTWLESGNADVRGKEPPENWSEGLKSWLREGYEAGAAWALASPPVAATQAPAVTAAPSVPADLVDLLPQPQTLGHRADGSVILGYSGAQMGATMRLVETWTRSKLAAAPAAPVAGPVDEDREPREPAPLNDLPSWSECDLIIKNHEFRERAAAGLEGAVLDLPPVTPEPTALHRFIHEYDDANLYRSDWFMHRLELVVKEASLSAEAAPVQAPATGDWIAAADVQRLTRELDVAMNGEAGAAPQAALCDVVTQAVAMFKADSPIAASPAAPEAAADRAEALQDRAYVAGAQAGYALGDAGDSEGLAKLVAARSEAVAVIKGTRAAAAPAPTVWAPKTVCPFCESEWVTAEQHDLWMNRESPVAQGGEPVATLHDDGCFTWKKDEYRRLYDRERVGWRMDVFASPPAREGLTEERVHQLYLELQAKVADLNSPAEMFAEIVRDVEAAHGIQPSKEGA